MLPTTGRMHDHIQTGWCGERISVVDDRPLHAWVPAVRDHLRHTVPSTTGRDREPVTVVATEPEIPSDGGHNVEATVNRYKVEVEVVTLCVIYKDAEDEQDAAEKAGNMDGCDIVNEAVHSESGGIEVGDIQREDEE